MIRIIVVEDSRLIREGIEKHVPWNKLGIDEIRTAENAEKALKVCETFKPDIIISDIKMPGMNGIELCSRFKETLPESQIIFISGYSNKEYLMSAITLKAIHYVQKPISVPEISEAVEKAVVSVKRLRRQKLNLLHSLLSPRELEKDDVLKNLNTLEMGKDLNQDSFFRIGILKISKKIENLSLFCQKCRNEIAKDFKCQEIHFLADFIKDNIVIMLISGQDKTISSDKNFNKTFWRILNKVRNNDDKWFLGIGKNVDTLSSLSESYQSAERAMESLSFRGWNTYGLYDDFFSEKPENTLDSLIDRFREILLTKQQEATLTFLDNLFEKLIKEHILLNFNTRNIYFNLDQSLFKANKIHCAGDFLEYSPDDDFHFMNNAETIEELHNYVYAHVKFFFKKEKIDQERNFIINQLLDFMQRHYGDTSLSIQKLADMVLLTPTYICNLFKKKTGTTIGQTLMEIRLEKAKEYLKDPQYKIYQVAEKIGYDDSKYFTKIFKRNFGISPTEYRKNKLL